MALEQKFIVTSDIIGQQLTPGSGPYSDMNTMGFIWTYGNVEDFSNVNVGSSDTAGQMVVNGGMLGDTHASITAAPGPDKSYLKIGGVAGTGDYTLTSFGADTMAELILDAPGAVGATLANHIIFGAGGGMIELGSNMKFASFTVTVGASPGLTSADALLASGLHNSLTLNDANGAPVYTFSHWNSSDPGGAFSMGTDTKTGDMFIART